MDQKRVWGEAIDRAAAEQLGIGPEQTVAYMATNIIVVIDKEEIAELVREDMEIEESLDTATMDIDMPGRLFFVGMRDIDGDADSKRTYGIVDLSGVPWPSVGEKP